MRFFDGLFGHKSRLVVVVRGEQMQETSIALEKVIRPKGVFGRMRIAANFAEIVLEGSQRKLQPIPHEIWSSPEIRYGRKLEVGWLPYLGEFDAFRVSMDFPH